MSAAPPGRVQPATDFNPASYGSVIPGGSYLERSTSRSETQDSIDEEGQEGDNSVAGTSRRTISEGDDEDATYMYGRDGDDPDWGATSMLSDFASIFHPNEYIVAQQRLDEQERRSDFESFDEERQPMLSSSYTSRRQSATAFSHRRPSAVSSLRPSVYSHRRPHLIQEEDVIREGSAWSKAPTEQGDISGISIRQALVDPSPNPGTNLGLMLIAVSQVSYSTMNLFVKLLDDREGQGDTQAIGALEIVGVECLIIWIGCMLAMCLAKTEHILLGPPGARALLLARGMFGFSSTLALYISLHALSLSDATVITFLSPLATGFLAHIMLHEPFTVRERIAGVLSLAGVTLIARPSFLFGKNTGEGVPEDGDVEIPPPSEPGSATEADRIVGILVALCGVVLMAGAWVCLRRIGKRASTYHSIAYFSLCSWVSSFVAMWVLDQPFVIPSSTLSLMLLLAVGLFSLLAQVFQTLGLQRESAGRAATMSYLQIIFALAWQLLLFGSVPDWVSMVGSVVILGSGAWVALSKEGGSAPMH
ncbi:Drug/metabolite transporter [Kalmanozyma brasiliensis GHG001]|uniref:EamA domain-containing protein n=1 Tax=Kalmanozyma brasiliensis (strain GHG001) TaxID=1365824 RepID=V5GT75_KALBG|nr:Drug/metabolite transporter [Kalmanozyma brasiliensis GHG001]EST09097.1 Drug/metabolite transporter [Kalmanozyma brasiliensis GHG001]